MSASTLCIPVNIYLPIPELFSGAMGKAVIIDKNKLSKEERQKFDGGWQRNAFNEYASDKISLHRTLPDIRDPE